MFHILIDTCVWLDLAKDHKKESLLTVVAELVERKELTLIVPEIIIDEFERNKDHVAKDGSKSIVAAIKRAKDAVHKFGDTKNRAGIQKYLSDIGHKIPLVSEQALESLVLVSKLLRNSSIIPISDVVKLAAVQRGMDKKAPFHKGRNSINDSLLIETYREYKNINNKPGDRFAFVTHNKNDFSDHLNETKPHTDLANLFSRSKSVYSITLGETLKKIKPELVTDIMMEAEFELIPRTLHEIYKAEVELENKIWYNRHQNWLYKIEKGSHQIVKRSQYKGTSNTTPLDIFKGARKTAKEMKAKYGENNLGPWTDFEWGMLNGKLSALRWVIGEDWDSLYT